MSDYSLQAFPYFDDKWIQADLESSLRSPEYVQILWNNLIKDQELVTSKYRKVLNGSGNVAYLSTNGRYYCGVEKVDCVCNKGCLGVCHPKTYCNCHSCQLVDGDDAKPNSTEPEIDTGIFSNLCSADDILESWLWGPTPSPEAKSECVKRLVREQREMLLQVAGNSITAQHLQQILFVYRRYLVALLRKQKVKNVAKRPMCKSGQLGKTDIERKVLQHTKTDLTTKKPISESGSLGLARVGTRAALNFSFAFLKRAWRSGEDAELCSELLLDALEALQLLPEASLFNAVDISSLWLEVLENSIKFLRNVVIDDISEKFSIPQGDRCIALSLLIELAIQKGTLSATLEAVILLLTLADKEKQCNDNRGTKVVQGIGAPLLSILRRYENINCDQFCGERRDTVDPSTSPTESFLRFLSLSDNEAGNIDLKKAAVVVISHLDRLAQPHLPNYDCLPGVNDRYKPTKMHTMGLIPGALIKNDLNATSTYDEIFTDTLVDWLNTPIVIRKMCCTREKILLLCDKGDVYSFTSHNGNKLSAEVSSIKRIDGFGGNPVLDIQAHCEGNHFLALNSDHHVFAWGYGDDGCLGIGDTAPRKTPTKIITLADKFISKIYCGVSSSAAISISGELFTWGLGTNGNLGHSSNDDKLVPTHVEGLIGHLVSDVALGSIEIASLCITDTGAIYAWGGCCSISQSPVQLTGLPIASRIFLNTRVYVAIMHDGSVFEWPRKYVERLCTDTTAYGRRKMTVSEEFDGAPKRLNALDGKHVIDVAMGTAHCVALTTSGELFGWGRNDFNQINRSEDQFIVNPMKIPLPTSHVKGLITGSTSTIVFCNSSKVVLRSREQYIVDLSETTFSFLDKLLNTICYSCDTSKPSMTASTALRPPPSQEMECIYVATLNLIRLQLHAIQINSIDPKSVGLAEGSMLLNNMKAKIIDLASGSNVLKTIQDAAQWTLKIGWSILLPSAAKRAQTLTSLLQGDSGTLSPQYNFMTNLLVGSLMADDNLQVALKQAINSDPDKELQTDTLPILHLVNQLLTNNMVVTQANFIHMMSSTHMKRVDEHPSRSPGIVLLHRFQRLLLSYAYNLEGEDLIGVENLLEQYIQNVIGLCVRTLTKAYEAALDFNCKEFVADVLIDDISDTILYELLIGLVLLHCDKDTLILQHLDWNSTFVPLISILDKLNRMILDVNPQDVNDLSWPGIVCRSASKWLSSAKKDRIIRKDDFENHVLDGGQWIVIDGNVYDVDNFRGENPLTSEIITKGIGKDLTNELNMQQHGKDLNHIINHLKIGRFFIEDFSEKDQSYRQSKYRLTHLQSEKTVSFLIGLRACRKERASQLQPAEIQVKDLLNSPVFSGGLQILQPTNPFDEEKGDARSSASTTSNTPTEVSNKLLESGVVARSGYSQLSVMQRVDYFLNGLVDGRSNDPMVSTWFTISERYCKENNLIWHQDFPTDHPISELGRLLVAVLIRHQCIGPIILDTIDQEIGGTVNEEITKPVYDLIKIVHDAKWTLIKTRQQLNRSYKEVCAPMLEKCRFLLYEVRPAISTEQCALKRLNILYKPQRFKSIVQRIIYENKMAKKLTACAKPEDVFNVKQCRNGVSKQQGTDGVNQANVDVELIRSHIDLASVDDGSLNNSLHGDDTNILREKSTIIFETDFLEEGKEVQEKNISHCHKHDDKTIENILKMLHNKNINLARMPVNLDDSHVNQVSLMIIEFIIESTCDVETIRRAMYCQMQRYHTRKQGLQLFSMMCNKTNLTDAAQYLLLNGYLGLFLSSDKQHYAPTVLSDLNMITCFQKADLLIEHSNIIKWALVNQRMYANEFSQHQPQTTPDDKNNSNIGTYVFLKKLPRVRFLLNVLGILSKNNEPNEISLIINSGTIGCLLSLLRQIGADSETSNVKCECTYACRDLPVKKCKPNDLTGRQLAKQMTAGTRVSKGADWKWGEQDGCRGIGNVSNELAGDGWVRVEWEAGASNCYRMGRDGQYDLRLADSTSIICSPETETEDKTSQIETKATANSHPTKLLKTVAVKLLHLLTITTSIYGDKIEQSALFNVSSTLRYLLQSKATLNRMGLQKMSLFAIMRALAQPQHLAIHFTSPIWLKLSLEIIQAPAINDYDFYKKIQCIRLLKKNLSFWGKPQSSNIDTTITTLFAALGQISVFCPNDLSLLHTKANFKLRQLTSASHSGTIAEELISLLRELHSLPLWNKAINAFIEQRICLAADVFSQKCETDRVDRVNQSGYIDELEKAMIIAALITIGGFDPRPRIGLQLKNHDMNKIDGTITSFTQHGKIEVTMENEIPELFHGKRKISIGDVAAIADVTPFNLKHLPLNEVLLNSLMMLLSGPGEWKNVAIKEINISLLRAQQLHLSTISAISKFFSQQNLLRKILQQRCPRETPPVIPEKKSSKRTRTDASSLFGEEPWRDGESSENENSADISTAPSDELLFQSMLTRSIQPNPLRTIYSYDELILAAVNIIQDLCAYPYMNNVNVTNKVCPESPSRHDNQINLQATMVHGQPVYNSVINELDAIELNEKNNSKSSRSTEVELNIAPVFRISDKDMQAALNMGFSERSIRIAANALYSQSKTLKIDRILEWIFEHPDDCHRSETAVEIETDNCNHSFSGDSDQESISSADGAYAAKSKPKKYATIKNFESIDQYALYVRGHVKTGMVVRCCKDFEEIVCGDIGTVLKVDTEGLHDLNVQVEWKSHGGHYWMRFVHIEILDQEKVPSKFKMPSIGLGSSVRIRLLRRDDICDRISDDTLGVVTSMQDDNTVTVDVSGQYQWTGKLSDLEIVHEPNLSATEAAPDPDEDEYGDIIDDWSHCIQSLTVSSNESSARYLLDKSENYWQSNSTHNIGSGKHWIRLHMHDNILIHSLSILVNGADGSHMPSLIVIRVGSSVDDLREYSWVSVKQSDFNILLLAEIKEYYSWIEVVIKQCYNNGIQCKIHGIDVVGRLKQTDLDKMLIDASFLVNETDDDDSANASYYENVPASDAKCKVYVWGLNDKEQLAGVKGSKAKCPVYSTALSQLRPVHIAGGSKSLFIVSQDGKVYASGEGTNGRLGLGNNCNVSTPRQLPVINQFVVKKVAVHSGGKHAMALTLDGKVFSWGEGEDGKLGHNNRITLNKPKQIEALRHKRIRDIACGSSHSAAITNCGELYTWGLGEYGRLGHGDNCTQLKPKRVEALSGHRVVQVACGSRDAQTLALTEEGIVFSWGDGDFGKLGRGGSEGCLLPQQVDKLNNAGVLQIECGAQFSLALTESGEVWTWGKGDYYRLGHGTDQHVRKPMPIQSLRGHKIVHVAVGALHCLAVSDSGRVYAFGDNDHGQQGTGSTAVNKKPSMVSGLDKVFINRVACGSSHSVAWKFVKSTSDELKEGAVPFPTSKDPLGSISLGIYSNQSQVRYPSLRSNTRPSLSQTILTLHSSAAKQKALNYILNALSILQARQCIIAALTSHSDISKPQSKKIVKNYMSELDTIKEATVKQSGMDYSQAAEMIVSDGGEGLVDFTALRNADSPELSTPDQSIPPVPNEIQSVNNSMSASISSSYNVVQKHKKMSTSAMSVMTAIISQNEENLNENVTTDLDDFISMLKEPEVKNLIELLKLTISGNDKCPNAQTIANTLISIALIVPEINNMIFETCITELEDICTTRHFFNKTPKPIVQETSHPYIDDITLEGHVRIPYAKALLIEFDQHCSTEKRHDQLIIMDATGRVFATRCGREYAHWAEQIRIPGNEMKWKFVSDGSVNGWGWRFWVHGIMPSDYVHNSESDYSILCQPSMSLVMSLLDSAIEPLNQSILLRLASSLLPCIDLSTLSTAERIWATQKLHNILKLKIAPNPLDPALSFLSPIMPLLQKQYEYEDPLVRAGLYLMHSDYFKNLAALSCDMHLDHFIEVPLHHKWTWFKGYCSAVRVAQSIIKRTEIPNRFLCVVREKLTEMSPGMMAIYTPVKANQTLHNRMVELKGQTSGTSNQETPTRVYDILHAMASTKSVCSSDGESSEYMGEFYRHEDHRIFQAQHDRQLLQWISQRPEDWKISWGGASTIYGWGHNHRGQLGGLEGSRIKTPTQCESLSLLRPIFICGGEQTLFAISPDGKLHVTGYGAGGRLGIGGVDSVSTPSIVDSLQHIFIKKVAVNSGGKHCMVLSSDGDVYSWGEGDDGKLGHNNRINYDRPKLITSLTGMGVVDIACGSSHSACITASGHILTWGKGRYGRLGHGDSDDQLRPKLVEALLGYRVIDVACGSGDAQTLCITDDDNVWSFGDGDYGKLGRGGSEGCKVPIKIESLAGLGVIKVECGSQFSVALTRSGSVYTWGKGDYHRLGHGTTDHVRRPKKVNALQGKKIISIATGSLHCVACSDAGEVFTWGDNDEGQLGDGTVSAIQRPRLVTALQGKRIIKVTCGSAHTIALSTSGISVPSRPPPLTPLEYDFIRDLPSIWQLRRLVLLHHFSELICSCVPLLTTRGEVSLDALKDILVYDIKEAFFRKIIQTTMVRDKQHGPVIELNRIHVKRARSRAYGGLAGPNGMKSVFGQMVQKLPLLTQESLYLPHRVWKVKFVGESVDDCGGGFSESIAEMCDELQNGSVPLLIQTPNGRGEAGANRDCFLLDPTLHTVLQMNMFRFLGVLMGIAVRTGSPLSLNLAEPVWRQLAGEELRPSDLTEVDRDYVASLICIRDMDNDPKLFESLDLPFTTPSAKGHEVPLSTKYTRVMPENKKEYVRLALNYRLHEFDEQVKAVRDGMSKVVPVPLLSLFTAGQIQTLVCGSPEIPLDLLKSVATYKGVEVTSSLVQWFWEVMEEFSNQERSLFLRFVWGRTRLPRTIADFRGRDFVLQVLDKYQPPDHFLPESYTCFFLLKMPRYTSKAILAEKLKYAIYFCKSIDTDEYARVALAEQTDQTASENHSDMCSEASEDL